MLTPPFPLYLKYTKKVAVIQDVSLFARSVIENQQRLLVNSYVPVDEKMVAEIYADLL